jgi:hypothetical protein
MAELQGGEVKAFDQIDNGPQLLYLGCAMEKTAM